MDELPLSYLNCYSFVFKALPERSVILATNILTKPSNIELCFVPDCGNSACEDA